MTSLSTNLLEPQEADKDKTALIYYDNDHAKSKLTFWQLKEIIREKLLPIIDSFQGDLIQLEFDVNHRDIIFIVPCILSIAFSGKCAFYVTTEPSAEGATLSFKDGHYSLVIRNEQENKSKGKFLYYVHTSGTSGTSRRQVRVPISCIWSNVEDFLAVFKLGENDTIFSAAPPSFDPFYLDIFVAFLSRASLLMTSQTTKMQGGTGLAEILEKHNVTFAQMTPSLYRNLGTCFPKCFRYLLLGGEMFPEVLEPRDNLKIYNLYGLTEMSVWQSMVQVNAKSAQQPIHIEGENLLKNTQLRLEGQEIVVESQSRACYFDGAFHSVVRTKDAGHQQDGQIFYSGRLDDVVKIHGRQITISLVEKAWKAAFNAPAFCVLTYNRHFIAYVQVDQTAQSIHDLAAKKLPGHFRPLGVVCQTSPPPTNANGKIDREAIKKMLTKETITIETLWTRHTGRQPTPSSNFITDGGDSFAAVLIAETIGQPFLVETLLRKSFDQVKASLHQERWVDHMKQAKVETLANKLSSSLRPFVFRWRQNMGKCIDGSPVLIAPNKVIIGSHKGLFGAFDLAKGTELWKVQLDDRIEATASASDGLAFIGTYAGSMYCIDIANGKIVWQNTEAQDVIKTKPLVVDDKLFFSCHDGFVRCLLKHDGSLAWKQNVGTSSQLLHHAFSLISASLRGQLHVFHQTCGTKRWSKQLDSPIFSTPTISEDHCLIVASVKGLVTSFQLETGAILWTLDTQACHIFGPLLYHSGLCFHGSQEGMMNAIDATTGLVRWSVQMTQPVQAGACVLSAEDLFIIDIESNFKIVDLMQGNLKHEGCLGIGKTFSAALKAGCNLIIGSRDDHLYAFEIL